MLSAAAALTFLAAALSACATGQPAATPTLLDQLPIPTSAVLGIGRDGPGYDDGASFVTYVSQLPPEAALEGYSRQLVAAGYVQIGQEGAWRLFSRDGMEIAVSVSPGGPPSTIIVRLGGPGHGTGGLSTQPLTPPDPATAGATGHGNSGKTPDPANNGNNGNNGNNNGGNGNNNGNGNGNNGGGVVPPPEHATPKPHPTPPPKVTQPPKETPAPKDTQPPKHTPAPKNTQAPRQTDKAKP